LIRFPFEAYSSSPRTAAMNPISSFRDFTLHPAGPSLEPAVAAEVVTLWTTKAGLPRQEASRRLGELLVLVRDPGGRLIGVSTAQQGRVHEGGEEHCFLRMFFQPESRGVRGLAAHVLEVAFDLLASRHAVPSAPVGGILVTENPKLHSRRAVEVFRRIGWQHLGRGPQDREWFGRRFDGTPYEGRILPESGKM
jgi:hypothetical protein